jgi:hypothetical protein
MVLTATTKLASVNIMLQTIGESPTNTLTGTLPYETSLAVDILDEVIKELCLDEYVFNFEEEVSVTPDGSNRLIAQSNWIRVQPSDGIDEYVLRETTTGSGIYMVYDITNKTSTAWTTAKKLDVTYMLEFEDLPEAAKRYVTIRSARIYADRLMASPDVRAFTERDEFEAKAKLLNYETAIDEPNMLRDNPDTYSVLNRRIR